MVKAGGKTGEVNSLARHGLMGLSMCAPCLLVNFDQ